MSRRLYYLSIFLIFFLVLEVRSFAEGNDIFKASIEAIDKLRDKVKVYTLANGLRIVMYPRGFAPVFSSVIKIGVGGVDEHEGETGISHMFEHMAFKGTESIGTKNYTEEKILLDQLDDLASIDPSFSKLNSDQKNARALISKKLSQISSGEEYSRQYEKRGALGLNASTDKDHTSYYVNLPKKSFEYWAKVESDRLLNPVMREFYQERNVVLEERRMRFENDPIGKLYEEFLQKSFPSHPYGLPLIGYERDIRNLTARKLDAFRKKYYTPQNIVIALVGDITPETDIAIMDKYFGRLTYHSLPKNSVPEILYDAGEVKFSTKADAKPIILVGYHKPNYPHAEDAILSVLSECLAGSSRSPFIKTLVKEEKIAISISNTEAPGNRFSNLLIFNITPQTGLTTEFVLGKFDQVLAEALTNLDPNLIELSKRKIASAYISQLRSSSSLASNLAEVELTHGSWKALIDWYKQVMDVSLEDIKREGVKYLNKNNRVVGFIEQSKK